MSEEHINFEYSILKKELDLIVNKSLLEVDKNNAFAKTLNNPKVTGIAGDVIEKSVLGYNSNSYQSPDIKIDGIDYEVKTTGIRYSVKSKKNKIQVNTDFEAKEPMSITAVSPNKIVTETFENSNFWHKLENLLLIYYHYDSTKTVQSWEYKNFKIKGYDFHNFSKIDKKRLFNDWKKVQDFIKDAKNNFEYPEERYSELGTLRSELLLIDTAPKWPNSPRFRLKRSTVTAMVQETFENKKFEQLDNFDSMDSIDNILKTATKDYKGLSIAELITKLNIENTWEKEQKDVPKSITENILLHILNSKSKKLNNIDIFVKANITLKTIVQTSTKKHTEDTKLEKIDFNDLITNESFENSQFFNYFNESQFIFIIFEEKNKFSKLSENIFLGFKRIYFSDEFINNDVKKCWSHTRNLITSKKLEETIITRKNTNIPLKNKNGTLKTSINFLKSKENTIFLRGSGKDSSIKPLKINNISMYQQYFWIKGSYIIKLLNNTNFL